ncbi:hypothetical protein JCM3770_002886 [Rhodotorula araucariae]
MARSRLRRLHSLLAVAVFYSLALSARADDGDSEEQPTETTSSESPTDTARSGGGHPGAEMMQGQLSFASALASAFGATTTAEAPWATSTTGMTTYTDGDDTVVLHSEGSLTYGCPNGGDEWVVEDLTDSLSAHTTTGAGCYVSYAFKGDGVQVYGATGSDGGVFGCSVSAGSRNYTGWWNGYGTTNTYKPYQGSCAMYGLGYDEHTVLLVNSPYRPGKVWFTGLRYSTNKTEQLWETHTWDACCAEYTFPQGVATTVDVKPQATDSAAASGTTVVGMSSGTTALVVCGLGLVIALASLLIGCMCCKKRPATGDAGTKGSALRAALHSDSSDSAESQPLRGKQRSAARRKRQGGDSDSDDSSSSTGASSESEQEKGKRRRGRRR